MNTILLLLIFTGLVGLLLVVFFMLDRLNELHKHADLQKTPYKPDDSFGGLSGKDLWDAMIGVPMPGWDAQKLEPLRPRYEALLQKHLELLFEDGKLDAREGFAMPVRCDRKVTTLRGEIDSWMPHEYASGIYRAAQDLINLPPEEHAAVIDRIDYIGDALYSATNLPPRHPLSKVLVPASRPQDETPSLGYDDPAADESLADTDETAAPEDMLAAPEEEAVAALPPPDEPDYLPVELPEQSGDTLPLAEADQPAEELAHATDPVPQDTDTMTEPDATTVAETAAASAEPAEPEKAAVT